HLIDVGAVGRGPRAPLRAVYRAEIALRVRPLVPDGNAGVLQRTHVRVAAQQPEELVHDGAEVQLLGGDGREPRFEIEAELPAEHAPRARAGAVLLLDAVLEHMAEKVQVGAHEVPPFGRYAGATGRTCGSPFRDIPESIVGSDALARQEDVRRPH